MASTGIVSLVLAYSLLCSTSCYRARSS
jgi:hypothetical protein